MSGRARGATPAEEGSTTWAEARVRAGFTEPGGFQERIVAPVDCLAVVPPGIDCVHAAQLTCALGTPTVPS
jgi:D-arabinose 1-dehydrogenase-like Zn-dependent alcohol dehydrogenase